MIYDRKIKYLDYLESGSKVRTAGFVKIEVQGEQCHILVSVNGLSAMDSYQRDVLLGDGNHESVLGQLCLKEGRGNLELRGLSVEDLGESRISYKKLENIRVKVSKDRELYCQWEVHKEKEESREEKQWEEIKRAEGEREEQEKRRLEEKIKSWKEEAEKHEQEEKAVGGAENITEHQQNNSEEQLYVTWMKEETEDYPEQQEHYILQEHYMLQEYDEQQKYDEQQEYQEKYTTIPLPSEEVSGSPKLPQQLYEDKWKQLTSIYPHISPFRDERDYLSIGPEDFVVLSRGFHKLVHNSFLLHGYYNYQHLILTRVMKRGEECFYIGVPGNFYEREKQVAVMFGFESFECRQEPAQMGDYGYYMIRVEI